MSKFKSAKDRLSKFKSAKDRLAESARSFDDDAKKLQREPPATDDLAMAVGYWLGYPSFFEDITAMPGATSDEKYVALHALNAAHLCAVRFLMREAKEHGLDDAGLWEAGRVCRELYDTRPPGILVRLGATQGGTWPDALGEARYKLPQAQQDAIRDGYAVFMALANATDYPSLGWSAYPTFSKGRTMSDLALLIEQLTVRVDGLIKSEAENWFVANGGLLDRGVEGTAEINHKHATERDGIRELGKLLADQLARQSESTKSVYSAVGCFSDIDSEAEKETGRWIDTKRELQSLASKMRVAPPDGANAERIIASLPTATHNESESSPKGTRGRTQETDPKEDKRIYDGWKASGYTKVEEYATKNGFKERDVKLALDRHKKRLQKAKEK